MTPVMAGVTHQSDDAEARGRVALSPAGARVFLQRVRTRAQGAVDEALVLSTCNRTEFYGVGRDAELASRALRVVVEETIGVTLRPTSAGGHGAVGEAVCRHLARVACGLDSLVLGEAEIQGQLRAATTTAREAGTWGPRLERVVAAALRAGGRARSETAIGIGSTSVASAAVSLGERVLRGITNKRVVIVGAGQAGRLALSRVLKRRPLEVTLLNRTFVRAEAAVAGTAARAGDLERLASTISTADLVIVAAQGPAWLISPNLLRALGPRQSRLVIVDIAMPAAVDPAVREVPGVKRYGIDELKGVVEDTRQRRMAVVPAVEAIAADESARVWRDWMRRNARSITHGTASRATFGDSELATRQVSTAGGHREGELSGEDVGPRSRMQHFVTT